MPPKRKCYLAGAIQDAKDGGAAWRLNITPKLEAMGIVVLDPCKSEANMGENGDIVETKEMLEGWIASGNMELFDRHMDRVIEDDIRAVTESDFIICLVDLDYAHGGTWCELWEAVWHCKNPVYVVCYGPKSKWNHWMLRVVRKGGQIFENFGQLMDFLEEKYSAKVKK